MGFDVHSAYRGLREFQNKRVLITGHTGFKGAWLCEVLLAAGAEVIGFALPAEPGSLFELLGLQNKMQSISGDIRRIEILRKAFQETKPEYVIHMAAQSLVRKSYREPAYTYDVNIMGTVNVMECIRETHSVRSVVNVTTDKVYRNREWVWGYRENEELDGYDPYSNSKSCSELITWSYARSFFKDGRTAISTARAGNVIGGGDFAQNRILPDCIRSAICGETIIIRNPESVRPYQHVLEALSAYLQIAAAQDRNIEKAGAYNVGPLESDCLATRKLADLFCRFWGEGAHWREMCDDGPHESRLLRLDCSRIYNELEWKPKWNAKIAVEKAVEWSKIYAFGGDVKDITKKQIFDYFEL